MMFNNIKKKTHLLLTLGELEYTVPQSMLMNKKSTKNIKKNILLQDTHVNNRKNRIN
jgi:hypothetical protein